MKTVILAGGKGTRLMPYTAVLPKPLMPLGDRAILELVVRQLAQQGLLDITLSVSHLAHLVEAVFGSGSDYGVEITYVREDFPLGTAGPLRLVGDLEGTFLVLNGDLVTTLDYRDLVRRHQASGNTLTIATKRREVRLDYGVIEIDSDHRDGARIIGFHEKPSIERMVSMGIYVLEPEVLELIPERRPFDFPELVNALLAEGNERIGAYVYDGLWLDIGRHEDYEQAVTLHEEGSLELGTALLSRVHHSVSSA
jgi:NDP-sugar pyrophosphorylase family protein